ncbi:MMPL family transporter [uncultured Desulfuromonas sp.]|uniref:efflux RND transporter permease subunit n=1 Tax=uncultured Desulfuromonas sp. TaxID=181013 RepID=UPI002AABE26D|nr:MMPL family transporter [uncultured Desulfuromonas sp.]
MKFALTQFSLKRPWLIIITVLALVVAFAIQFPAVTFDNDPENMLSADEPVRIFHHEVKDKYALYDFVIVGVVNETNPDGVFNVATLNRLDHLTQQLLHLQKNEQGLPEIVLPAHQGQPQQRTTYDLKPQGWWPRLLGIVFNHNPNDLFDAEGNSAIVERELMAPSVVDNIKQAGLGSLKLEYLMENPPRTEQEARQIAEDAMSNPLYRGTLVSEDRKAVCLYIPIIDKPYSYNVANLVQTLTADWPQEDQVLITGLPVAEDTFGVEMLVQMATSAPLAGVAIFLLMWLFFRNVSLIIAPMLVAIFSVVSAMGLLIGLGYDVHIMSSMIAIFLMPIAVADSVHILSEFYDTYHRFGNKKETIRYVIGHLFKPMLYTSLTTIAGFGSLAFTPIPPVEVFGLHVAFGVAVAWLLSMTFIPAYIMVAISEEKLSRAHLEQPHGPSSGMLSSLLEGMGRLSFSHGGTVLVVTVLLLVGAGYGISTINVNDNPVKWFTRGHDIRVADRVLNHHFGGTYTAYLTFAEVRPEACNREQKRALVRKRVQERFGEQFPQGVARIKAKLEELKANQRNVDGCDVHQCFHQLFLEAQKIDNQLMAGWNVLADEINYMDPTGLTRKQLVANLGSVAAQVPQELAALLKQLPNDNTLQGYPLMDAALKICDEHTGQSFASFILEMEAEVSAPPFKQPQMLRYVEGLQQALNEGGLVGKSTSAVDALKKAAYELSYVAPPADADGEELERYQQRNQAHFSVPDTASAVGQVFVQLEGMKKKDSLFHMVTRDYRETNVWIQLKSGDNQDMEAVVAQVEDYMQRNPPPVPLKNRWAGLTYLNVVWQDKMVNGMLSSLAGSFVVVLVMMMLLFRSIIWGALAMVPLTVTISLIYGLIGVAGKDYDMPVAVLSSLTLGLSVDFAIHFLQRARELYRQNGNWAESCKVMFKEPARAITRNAITISVGFTPLLLAPLVPYKTVGFFLATIMAVSWLASLVILPALLTVFQRWVFRQDVLDEGL